MPYTSAISGSQPVGNNTNGTKSTSLEDTMTKLKDELIKSSLQALFSPSKSKEPEVKEQEQKEDLSLLESFIDECIVAPTSELIVEEGKNYFYNLFAKNDNN